MKQFLKRALLLWCCLLLIFSLTLSAVASPSSRSIVEKEFKLSDGRVVTLSDGTEELVMTDNKDRHFRRISLQSVDSIRPIGESNKKPGQQQDSPGNLFGEGADKMIPGDQIQNYLYIDSVETTHSEVKLESNEVLIAQGGVIFLVTRLPDSSNSSEKETDTYGVEAYNEDLISEELLHRSLINVRSETYLNKEAVEPLLIKKGDPHWDIEDLKNNSETMRVDGCTFSNKENEKFEHVHKDDKTFESDPIFMGFVSDEYGIVSNIRVKVPLDLDNRFDNVQGRVVWEFYYVPGNIIEKHFKSLYEDGTNVPDEDLKTFFIPDENPAKSGPNIIVLGKTDPLGNLPQTGGGVEMPFAFTTFQTILLFVGIMFVGFLALDFLGLQKKKKEKSENKTEEP